MGDKPILFSGAMVRAILDGRKTQTRRVIRPYDSAPHPFQGKELATDLMMVPVCAVTFTALQCNIDTED